MSVTPARRLTCRFSRTALTPLAAMVALAALSAVTAVAADKEPDGPAALANHRTNRAWVIGGTRNDELQFQRAPGNEPVLVLNSAAFRGRQITIDLETDSTWFRITNGAVDLDLRVQPAKRYRISLDGDPGKPQIELNGKELIGQSPLWAKIINDENRPTFSLMLRDATEATVRMKSRGGQVKLRDANDTEGAPPPPGSTPPANVAPGFTPEQARIQPLTPEQAPAAPLDDAGVARLRKAVFSLRIPTGEPGVDIVAPAFLVSVDGYAITTFSPLRGATRATASFAAAPGNDIPVELIAARPELDLALIRLDPVRAAGLTGIAPLTFETDKLKADDTVRVLSPDGPTPIAPPGKLLAGMTAANLPANVVRSVRPADDSRWVQLESPIDAALSGSPVVNAAGRVVAIAAWHWHSPNERRVEAFAFYAGAAQQLAAAPPAKPVTFAAAADLAKSPGPQLAFPTLTVTGPGSGSDAEVRKVAVALRSAAVCPMCKGAGTVDKPVVVGQKNVGGIRRDILDTKPEPCPRCKGTSLNDPEAVYRLSKSLALAAARSPVVAADDSDASIAPLRATLADLMKLNAQGFASSINTMSGIALADEEASDDMRGQAVSMIARMHTEPTVGGIGDEPGGVRTLAFQSTARVVVLRSPHLSDVNPTPGAVWAGGLVAGYVHDDKGQRVPVLQSGFALSAKPDADAQR